MIAIDPRDIFVSCGHSQLSLGLHDSIFVWAVAIAKRSLIIRYDDSDTRLRNDLQAKYEGLRQIQLSRSRRERHHDRAVLCGLSRDGVALRLVIRGVLAATEAA